MFVIMAEGKNNHAIFLVDRTRIKNKWWTQNLDDALKFQNETAAIVQRDKLKYNNPEVVTWKYAKEMEIESDDIPDDDHPFSMEEGRGW